MPLIHERNSSVRRRQEWFEYADMCDAAKSVNFELWAWCAGVRFTHWTVMFTFRISDAPDARMPVIPSRKVSDPSAIKSVTMTSWIILYPVERGENRKSKRIYHRTSTSIYFSLSLCLSPHRLYRTLSYQRFTKHRRNYSYQFELMIRIANCAFCHLSNNEWARETDDSLKRWQKSERQVKRGWYRQGRETCYVCDVPQMFYLWVSSTQARSAQLASQLSHLSSEKNVWN